MAKEYFSTLNYTLANEDTQVEFELLPEGAVNVFSIAGSGARCLPLIARNPENLHVVDMSEAQLFLVELRYQAAKVLTYDEWLFFLGYRGAIQDGSKISNDRYELFKKIELSPKAKAYWEDSKSGWSSNGFILLGKWESHFQMLGKFFRDYLKCDFLPIFEAQSLSSQREVYDKQWPHLRWKTFIKIVASEYVFNKFLYKGHFSGSDGHKTESRSPSQFIFEEFGRVFNRQLVRKNYFMQTLFLGKIRFEEGLPIEAHRAIFEKVKNSRTKVHYHLGNLLEVLPQKPFSFISLSDTISYLDQKDANQLLQRLHADSPKGTTIVIRSFMRAPTQLDSSGWIQLKDKEAWASEIDGTAVYQFHLFKKES